MCSSVVFAQDIRRTISDSSDRPTEITSSVSPGPLFARERWPLFQSIRRRALSKKQAPRIILSWGPGFTGAHLSFLGFSRTKGKSKCASEIRRFCSKPGEGKHPALVRASTIRGAASGLSRGVMSERRPPTKKPPARFGQPPRLRRSHLAEVVSVARRANNDPFDCLRMRRATPAKAGQGGRDQDQRRRPEVLTTNHRPLDSQLAGHW